MSVTACVYEAEQAEGWVDDELDFPYIAEVALDVAEALAALEPVEIAYQPGDGTRYELAVVPLSSFVRASPRVANGVEWDACAFPGMLQGGLPSVQGGIAELNRRNYQPGSYLVAWMGHGAYPLRLGDRGPSGSLAASYIAEHWGTKSMTSACSIAILLRAVSGHLDTIAATRGTEQHGG